MRPLRWLSILRKTSPLFILGCQRSGTTMLLDVLGRAPGISAFGEGNKRAMTQDFSRLREERQIRRILSRSRTPVAAFKPLNDSQHVDRLLERHAGARVIWMYRGYADTINSLIVKWGPHQRKIVEWIAAHGDRAPVGEDRGESYPIYAERMTDETLSVVRELARDDLTDEEGAALVWYARNQIYFDRGLEDLENTLLVQYEDLVRSPDEWMRRVFDFLGRPYREEYVQGISASSVGKTHPPSLRPPIRERCEDLSERLARAYEAAVPR